MLTNLLYILIALFMLGVIIVLHELGHFLVGRACGIGVIEFSVGMGPKLFGWERKGIQYSVRAFPIGGYCKFVGEDDDNPAPNAMNNAPVWKRFLTVLAGPAMNILLAYVVAVVIYLSFPIPVDIVPVIDEIDDSLPAASVDLREGDLITAANGTAIAYGQEGIDALRAVIAESDDIVLTVLREDEELSVSISPAVNETDSGTVRQIGVVFSQIYERDGFLAAVTDGFQLLRRSSTMMLDVLRNLIFRFQGAEDVTGPIGTVALISRELQADFSLILDFMFVISLNLGIINLIPFPGLDGSRLLFLIVEGIRRKPVPPEKEGLVHAIGLVILLGLAAVLAVHDIITYIL